MFIRDHINFISFSEVLKHGALIEIRHDIVFRSWSGFDPVTLRSVRKRLKRDTGR